MELKFSVLEQLEEKMKGQENRITKRTEICKYLNKITEHYSINTASPQLTKFERNLYYSMICHRNSFFESIIPMELSNLNPLSNLHYLMFRFLTDKTRGILNYHEDIREFSPLYKVEYPSPSFSWNIPPIFMPFLAAYIIACNDKKGSLTLSNFFEKLNDAFTRSLSYSQNYISDESQDDLKNYFQLWTDNYLGKRYFLNLDNLLHLFPNDKQYQAAITQGFYPLTPILLVTPLYPNPVPYYLSLVLEYSIKKMKEQDPENLLPHLDSWEIQNEMAFFRSLVASIMFTIKSFRDSIHVAIQTHHIAGSKYELEVDDYISFMEDIYDSSPNLYAFSLQIENILRKFFYHANSDPDIQKGVNNKLLSISIVDEEEHIQLLTKNLDKCVQNVIKESDSLFKNIERSSNGRASDSLKIKVEQNYYSTFKENISKILIHFKKTVMDGYKKLPAPLYYHNKGIIEELGFSNNAFSERDIFKILSILVFHNKIVVSEYVKETLNSKGFQFPMTADEVVNLLLNLNDIIYHQ